MNIATDPVLEFLNEHDFPVPPSVLDKALGPSYRSIKRAVDDLEDRGFICRDEDYSSHFWITDRGRGYLDGEVDASDY